MMLSQFSGAVLDKDRVHRFLLWRFWNDSPRMMFIGLNPSTANELQDDPTVRRMCDFAERWGYGGIYFCNLFSFITPYPAELVTGRVSHAANTPAIRMALGLSVLTVCAWGDGIKAVEGGAERAGYIRDLLGAPMCFGLTAAGNPRHPLYLKADSELVEFSKEAIWVKSPESGA